MILKHIIQMLILLVLISCLNGMHISRQSHQGSKYAQSYYNVCITAMDPRGTGKIVYLSTHSDSGEYAKNLKLYSVSHCYSNQKWNLEYIRVFDIYCIKSVKFQKYLSYDINGPKGKGSGSPVYRDSCFDNEDFKFIENESGGFYIQTIIPGTYLTYQNDKSTPMFDIDKENPKWNFWISNGY